MAPRPPLPDRWLVAGVTRPGPSGGPIRAHHIFAALARRTGERQIPAHGRRGVPALALAVALGSAGWRRPLAVASTQLLPDRGLALLRGPVSAAVIDLHDEPVRQAEALGIELDPRRRAALRERFNANIDAFERLVVPSASFAALCGLPADRTVVVTNGTDSHRIRPGAPADAPTVALVSGAAPGRGIELLLEAMDQVRDVVPGAALQMALSATGGATADYRRALVAGLGPRSAWVTIEDVAYDRIGAFLEGAALAVVPHPPGAYYDVATPVKLFDAMAAGRPVVVTPRTETRRIVEEAAAGVVAASDSSEDLAQAISTLLTDDARRAELGARARQAAVERYDWSVLSERLADVLLA
jgi:glycosyltransferase involved in cell wall biosynthesis